jgi:protease-4
MEEKNSGGERPGVLLIVLATIGGLALLGFLFTFLITVLIVRGGVESVSEVSGNRIGIVEIKGVITTPEKALDAMKQFRENENVKAVVLRIDSPGGAVGASQEIFQEARRLDMVKPVIASLGNTAASGGYYSAVGARYIVANPGTVTGSIGVIMKLPNVEKLLEKLGIKTTVIKSGRLKDLASITRELSPEERAVLKSVMDDIHGQFIRDVAQGRSLPEEKVKSLADGRIFSGQQALELKLVDELGNFSVALDKAAEIAKISGEWKVLYPKKDKITAIREILEESGARTMLNLVDLMSQRNSSSAVVPE